MLEQAKEIVHKFNSIYEPVLVEPEILLPENGRNESIPERWLQPSSKRKDRGSGI